MATKFFTADWHVGEEAASNTHSLLRAAPTIILVQRWLHECNRRLKPDDTLYLLGDLAVTLEGYGVYAELPTCKKVVILGDKETNSKSLTEEQTTSAIYDAIGRDDSTVQRSDIVCIDGIDFTMAHKPSHCFESGLPAICGHVHGIWRTQCMPNGQPIINVGIDAWGQLVSEELIVHQYGAITKGYYDEEARVDLWKSI